MDSVDLSETESLPSSFKFVRGTMRSGTYVVRETRHKELVVVIFAAHVEPNGESLSQVASSFFSTELALRVHNIREKIVGTSSPTAVENLMLYI